jgi:hypothetical protein
MLTSEEMYALIEEALAESSHLPHCGSYGEQFIPARSDAI